MIIYKNILNRCAWVPESKPHYVKYHDEEWGVPVHNDAMHFEMLVLEGAQAGLSWETILLRREGYRKAFHNFDLKKIVKMKDEELEKLLKNPAIIRNRLKVFSVRKNAEVFIQIQKEFGSFDAYVWGFVGGKTGAIDWGKVTALPIKTEESDALSKDLKKRGMTFVGSTIIFAYMLAIGMVNGHTKECHRCNCH